MGKASERRKKRRQSYLSHLAETDPKHFQVEWAKRLESWGECIQRNVNAFADEKGRRAGSVFTKVDQVLSELEACGEPAILMEVEDTKSTLTAVCCKAVASVVYPGLYRPTHIWR